MEQYQISTDDERKLVRVVVHGDIPRDLGKEIITKGRLLAVESNYGILCDVRRATPKVAMADWFFLPRELEVLREAPTRYLKAAVLIPEEYAEEYNFYENVAANVGLSVKMFLEEEEAIAWLEGELPHEFD